MKKDILEEIIKENIKEDIDKIDVPNMDYVWNNIENKIQNETKERDSYFNKKIACIIAILVLSSYISIGFHNQSQANFRRILNFIYKENDESIDVSLDYKNPEEDMREKNINKPSETILKFNDIQNKTDFIVKKPSHIPMGYRLEKCLGYEDEEEILYIKLVYENENDSIEIKQEPVRGDYAHSIKMNPKYGEVKQFVENGLKYNVIKIKDNKFKIIWDMFETKYTAIGSSEKELKNLVISIK
ncbi:MAG: DUF4367 domain-containing protein [Tepidibacter sp.]|jgi:hypothetical protein|uniref:DUF4367 domain-containing protein n=1 Tax=Tepidibacter sp. TaxID=2529387 RepID=UPI0025EC6477|nr:DUF4367 domain-containing protein [Tepidibacter sp.]MCT4509036.1 DUF4367 domain-containing protein [Tepidibacter sp.]